MDSANLDKWAAFYGGAAGSQQWPSETLVRLFRGEYIPGLQRNYKGKRVIEIGFGSGNNLVFLASLGLSLSGTEVQESICDPARRELASRGIEADLRVGTNRSLPFPDEHFDFLVSWNVVHYEETEEAIRAALAEYRRVLKPGGRFFLSTTGPKDAILRDSTTLGGHRYRIGKDDDFRKGQVFFYFDSPRYIAHCFSEHFADVLAGRSTHDFFGRTIDSFIVTGVERRAG